MKDPETNEEWQEAVDGASFLLSLDSGKQYGLIDTDIAVNAERCEEILAAGKARGFVPAPDDELIDRFIQPRERATPLPGLASK